MDHQAEFKLLVLEKFGRWRPTPSTGARRAWFASRRTSPNYDGHAVQQINRNIG